MHSVFRHQCAGRLVSWFALGFLALAFTSPAGGQSMGSDAKRVRHEWDEPAPCRSPVRNALARWWRCDLIGFGHVIAMHGYGMDGDSIAIDSLVQGYSPDSVLRGGVSSFASGYSRLGIKRGVHVIFGANADPAPSVRREAGYTTFGIALDDSGRVACDAAVPDSIAESIVIRCDVEPLLAASVGLARVKLEGRNANGRLRSPADGYWRCTSSKWVLGGWGRAPTRIRFARDDWAIPDEELLVPVPRSVRHGRCEVPILASRLRIVSGFSSMFGVRVTDLASLITIDPSGGLRLPAHAWSCSAQASASP